MQVYLVGGAVRDRLLGRPVKDRDWVVVGATPAQLRAQGYKPVGADFPVFLHPETGEEYALARTERKHGRGYGGFVFHTGPEVTLEDDLSRRDLSINAMAETPEGQLVDPYGGAADLEARVLRHVSPAFVEDPLRVLRVARFMARYAAQGFRVAPETRDLMRKIADSGELAHLTAERVWQELVRALSEPMPSAFFRTLRDCGALGRVLPEVDLLYGVPQRAEWHPEIDCGVHTQMVVDAAARLAPGDSIVGFCALTHDLGKALTPASILPRHLGHEEGGLPPLAALCARLKVPREPAELARIVCAEHLHIHKLAELKPATIVDLIGRSDGWRKPGRLRVIGLACMADKRGRLGEADGAYPQAQWLLDCHAAGAAVSAADFVARGLHGAAIGEAIRIARIDAVRRVSVAWRAAV
ncbi:MAG: multifunctional CCA addition/repair protein [Xanthomonadales bacterium]|jgi:tRNA nucleotidyltransferase (CCA-adding enzyme)|nr:multifunctional CCA addition/repair protein [Xanthomonadales bacterium]